MKNRVLAVCALVVSFSLSTISAVCAQTVDGEGKPEKDLAGSRPNIIFLLTDDQGYGDVSAHGNPVLKTPTLDRLHSESLRFTIFTSVLPVHRLEVLCLRDGTNSRME